MRRFEALCNAVSSVTPPPRRAAHSPPDCSSLNLPCPGPAPSLQPCPAQQLAGAGQVPSLKQAAASLRPLPGGAQGGGPRQLGADNAVQGGMQASHTRVSDAVLGFPSPARFDICAGSTRPALPPPPRLALHCPPSLPPCPLPPSPPPPCLQDVRSNPWAAQRYYGEAEKLEQATREMVQDAG